jgi:hypothetical protein
VSIAAADYKAAMHHQEQTIGGVSLRTQNLVLGEAKPLELARNRLEKIGFETREEDAVSQDFQAACGGIVRRSHGPIP